MLFEKLLLWGAGHRFFAYEKNIREDFTVQIGKFDLQWDSNEKSISVSIPSNALLWKCSFPFIGVSSPSSGTYDERIKQWGGNFKIETPFMQRQSNHDSLDGIFFDQYERVLTIAGRVDFQGAAIPYNLTFHQSSEVESQLEFDLLFDPTAFSSSGAQMSFIKYWSHPNERFYGFGIQYSYIDMKGKTVPILVREQGNGRGLQPLTFLENVFMNYTGGAWDTTYAPSPYYVTSQKRSVFLTNYDYSAFDLTVKDSVKISILSNKMNGRIIGADSFLDIVQSFTSFTGRIKKLPDWITSGAVVGMELGQEHVEKTYKRLKQMDVPVAAFWLQDWVGLRSAPWGEALKWNWRVNHKQYPTWTDFIKNLRNEGVRVMNYFNPMFLNASQWIDEFDGVNYYDIIVDSDLALRTGPNKDLLNVYGSAIMVDIFKKESREWMKDLIRKSVLASGVSGYMCDFGESYPLAASDNPGTHFHNLYPDEWFKLNREVIDEMDEEIVIFTRSGFLKAPQYSTLIWLGDQMVTWDEFDGIKTVPVSAIHSGFSGYSVTHSDIGGYQSVEKYVFKYIRTKELFLRWCELSVFSSVFRTHYGTNPHTNWQFDSDDDTILKFGMYAKMFVAWKFYRDELFYEAENFGYPVIRHMIFHFSDDENVYDLKYQFLIGSEWIFAPILDPGVSHVKVYLPEGSWVHLWTGVKYTGNQWIIVEAPLGKPCLFYPENSVRGERYKKNLDSLGISGL
jgi:alpha-glucosidase (family GH31 glycosyl hydrolase)